MKLKQIDKKIYLFFYAQDSENEKKVRYETEFK